MVCPVTISMRLSALRHYGGDLKNLYDSPRFEAGARTAGHSCKKDDRFFRKPWQVNPRVDDNL